MPRTSEEMISMSMLMPTRRNRGLLSDFMFDPFDAFFNTPMPSASTPTLMRTDIKETESGFEMTIDLPGFKKDEIDVDLKDGYLTISASKGLDKDQKDKEGKYIRQERYAGAMSRSFYVGDVQPEQISAKYEDGILKISLPKQEKKELPKSTTIAIG